MMIFCIDASLLLAVYKICTIQSTIYFHKRIRIMLEFVQYNQEYTSIKEQELCEHILNKIQVKIFQHYKINESNNTRQNITIKPRKRPVSQENDGLGSNVRSTNLYDFNSRTMFNIFATI